MPYCSSHKFPTQLHLSGRAFLLTSTTYYHRLMSSSLVRSNQILSNFTRVSIYIILLCLTPLFNTSTTVYYVQITNLCLLVMHLTGRIFLVNYIQADYNNRNWNTNWLVCSFPAFPSFYWDIRSLFHFHCVCINVSISELWQI